MTTAREITEIFETLRNEEQRKVLMRFFKTAPGEYGEGDEFLGVKVPQTRDVVKAAKSEVSFEEIAKLLYDKYHEVRLCGFLLLVEEMKKAVQRKNDSADSLGSRRKEIAEFYLLHARQANNWDLVDLSAPGIVGTWLLYSDTDRSILDKLASSDNLWEQRIAEVSTLTLIRAMQFADTLRISEKLLPHPHDLIHKAVGWMLREAGKRDIKVLRGFLESHCERMHRTTLRYAIEKMSAPERQYWLSFGR